MVTPNPIERERIALKLDTFRFVAEAHIELLQNDPLLREQLNLRMQIVQGYLKELDHWENWGNQVSYNSALDSAKSALMRVKDVIDQILDQ